MAFTNRGNYIGDSDPSQEERFSSCSQCSKMMDMDREMKDGVCYRCEPFDDEDREDE